MKRKYRHDFFYWILRPPFRLFLYIKYRFKAKRFRRQRKVKGPCLVLANHALAMDPFLLGLSFYEPMYYVASDMIFSIPFWSKIIRYMVNPIPKTKYRSDMDTIRDIRSVVKSRGSICIFPEGNASFSGETMAIHPSIAKLIKMLKLPVLFYRIEGGYLSKPRWARYSRKGKITGYVKKIWFYEEYKELTVEAIHAEVLEQLYYNIYLQQKEIPHRFKGKALAEDIESTMFYCPNCQSFETLVSRDNHVTCTACAYHTIFTEEGYFIPQADIRYFENCVEWFRQQTLYLEEKLTSIDGDEPLFIDHQEMVYDVRRSTKKTPLGLAKLTLFKTHVTIEFASGECESWSIDSLNASVQQKNKLILYNKELQKTYYFVNHPKRNAIKYVLAVDALKKE